MQYIRDTYGVPAKRGARVRYSTAAGPRAGTITSARNGKVRIRFDGLKNSYLHHPTWKLEYLEAQS